MLKQFELENALQSKLNKMTDDQLNQLYLRVFNTDDGLLVLRDLANRSFIEYPTVDDRDEGMRMLYLSIVGRMKGTTRQ